jgi:hypothetical protein
MKSEMPVGSVTREAMELRISHLSPPGLISTVA